MADVHFDNALQTAWSTVASLDTVTSLLESLTLIRDVQGRITLYLEPAEEGALEPRVVEEMKQRLIAALGPFFSGDVWVASADDEVMTSLEDIIKSERIRANWVEHDPAFSWKPLVYVLERRVAKEFWKDQGALEPDLPWLISEVDDGRRPAIVTFYSFKGGQGRTTSLAATSLVLARRGFRVGLIDLDLEAPGLGSVFFPDESELTGVVDYLINKPILEDAFTLDGCVLSVADRTLIGDGSPIRVLPAGSVNANYLEKLSRLDFQHQMSGLVRQMLKRLVIEVADTYDLDFLFLDSRAGFHDLGGLAVTQLSHAVVLLGNHSRQTWAGLAPVVHALSGYGVREPIPVVLVHAMAPGPSHPNFTYETRLFRETAYDVFQKYYYLDLGDISVPNENDPDAPFHPVIVPWNDHLRADLKLSRGSDDDPHRLQAMVGVMTAQPYTELAERLISFFGKDPQSERG